ncbi:MAG: hypothetical protein OXI87_17880 [Albidovulum sp.]|nr:hypothetical protein [Albidovulum sp.]MDE0306724.1 hypothetical protein [Albidovulum sp.]
MNPFSIEIERSADAPEDLVKISCVRKRGAKARSPLAIALILRGSMNGN